MKITLTNELGNDITVETLKDEKPDCKYIMLSIEGPTSMGQWIITEDEAKALHKALGDVLK